jgi:predicted site-specific integrase-resolvase
MTNTTNPHGSEQANNNPGRMLDKQEVLQIFCCSPRTLARRRKDGTLQYVAFGRKFFYPEEVVNKIFMRRKQ